MDNTSRESDTGLIIIKDMPSDKNVMEGDEDDDRRISIRIMGNDLFLGMAQLIVLSSLYCCC